MCDVIIKIEDEEFYVYRNIFFVSFDYFFVMFNGNMKECYVWEVIISGVDKDSMKIIMNFIYIGEIILDWNNVEFIL